MQNPIVEITAAMVESYHRKAAANAAKFFKQMLLGPILRQRWENFSTKNRRSLSVDTVQANTHLIIFGFYLAAGAVEGLFLSEMISSVFYPNEVEYSAKHIAISLLAGIAPIGFSLLIGHMAHQIHFRQDKYAAGEYSIRWSWVTTTIVCALIYLAFLMVLSQISIKNELLTQCFVLLLGMIELVLGWAAVEGLNLWIIRRTEQAYFNCIVKNTQRMLNLSELCTTNFRTYQITLKVYNSQQNDLMLEFHNSPQIQRAIAFYEGRFDGGNDRQIN